MASALEALSSSVRRSSRSSAPSVVVRSVVDVSDGDEGPGVDPVTVTRSAADLALSVTMPLSTTNEASSIV